MNKDAIRKEYTLDGRNLKFSELNRILDSLWEEVQKDCGLRDKALEQSIDLDKLKGIKRNEAIEITGKVAGYDTTGFFILIFSAPIAQKMLIDLWEIFLEYIKQKKGKNVIK